MQLAHLWMTTPRTLPCTLCAAAAIFTAFQRSGNAEDAQLLAGQPGSSEPAAAADAGGGEADDRDRLLPHQEGSAIANA